MEKKRVSIEYIRWLQEERAKINRLELENIEFFENGFPVDIPKERIEAFKFVGLNNTDFVLTEAYKDETLGM